MVALIIGALSLAAWLYLLLARGGFWRCDQLLEAEIEFQDGTVSPMGWPPVVAVIPARDEASVISAALRSLFGQQYRGRFHIIVVDDHSSDPTALVATRTAEVAGRGSDLTVISAPPLKEGWSGKISAQAAGIAAAGRILPDVTWLLLTDADIRHGPNMLARMVAKAESEQRHLVSVMVLLKAEGLAAKLLIPAFVFFFQKLYPFRWVNDVKRRLAAAAGGAMLVRARTLHDIGGMDAIRAELIDDCALARRIKQKGRDEQRSIWLGLSRESVSLRPYPALSDIWRMVARSAYTELDHSVVRLAGTLIGMLLLYVAPPILALFGLMASVSDQLAIAGFLGLASWALMSLAFAPALTLYGRTTWWASLLPLAGFLYAVMTLDSALRHWRGKGGAWKGRTYARESGTRLKNAAGKGRHGHPSP
jgi:hopene-associated glycosyltransferase HpnB